MNSEPMSRIQRATAQELPAATPPVGERLIGVQCNSG